MKKKNIPCADCCMRRKYEAKSSFACFSFLALAHSLLPRLEGFYEEPS